ncbi:MAG: serine hydrolase [Gammaproteobacteria bacterium]|nr:serine hydrolase [Gammaproteobacteria bacterium]
MTQSRRKHLGINTYEHETNHDEEFNMIIQIRKILLAGLILPFFLNIAWGQPAFIDRFDSVTPSSEYESAIENAREQIQVLIDNGAPGVSIAVGVDQQLVWAEGFGYANIENRTPVTPLTKFRVGSIAKPMTSIAMALLYEQGLLDLDAPIQEYVSYFPVKEKGAVTLRLLASHRAGIRHYLPDGSDFLITKHYDDAKDGLEVFMDDPLIAVPGDRYSYSSYGYNLLGVILQEASGQDYVSLMREQVFSPLSLTATVADHTDYIIEDRAAPYTRREDGLLRNAPYVDNSYKIPSGGFLSTPSDLVKFGFGVFNGSIIKNETLELLLSPPIMSNGELADQNYGLGWLQFGEWYGHTGGSVGGHTLFMVHPEHDVVLAVVCNLSNCLSVNPQLLEIGDFFVNEN